MQISIGGYSFCNTYKEGKMDVFHYLETIKYRYGLDTVDLWNGTFAKIEGPLLYPPEDDFIKKLREALDEKEMTLVNVAIDGAHLWDDDPVIREKLYENALSYLKIGEILGAKTVRIDTGGDYNGDPRMTDEQFEYIVKRYQEFSEIAAQSGFKVGPENHMGPSLSPRNMNKIAEAVNHPNYGVLLHLGRWQEDKEIGDELIAPWAYHTHLDQKTVIADDTVLKMRMLLDNGYDGCWGIEYNAEGNQFVEMEWIIAMVKKLLVKLEK